MKISIIGGTGEFGSLYAGLFKKWGFDVCIAGRDFDKAEKVAKALGIRAAEAKEAVSDADIVIVSVPIEVSKKTVKEIIPYLKKNSLLMDFTSVKKEVVKEMSKAKADEIVSCHPLHGPRIKSLEGQAVVFIPLKKGEKYRLVRGFFESSGARVYEMKSEEHDKLLAVVQSLTHFILIATASTLRELEVDVKKSRAIATPVYELALDLVARVIGQNPHVYAQIQMNNQYSLEVHRKFIAEAKKLTAMVRKKETGKFISLMGRSAKHFGSVEDAMSKSDKAIAALTEELGSLKEALGKKVALRNIYTNVLHFGLLSNVTPEFIELVVNKDSIKLKVDNVRLLKGKELIEWKRQAVVKKDFSFLFNECDQNVVKELGESINEDILAVEIKDVYMLDGKKSVTLRFSIFAEADIKMIEDMIRRRFLGIGAKIR